ncbi:uncharacterized protein [Spinacia oleracea]|uniref:Reverse transcriptase domain-containing protein n=1 Tax=Spinacia oleracea TaxID=3562 RepID=A0ABM3QXZ6_SPIOL|nr:uncharacterized protein LOC130463207 [Spinacia oleracea]
MNAIKVLLREDGSRACLQSSIKEEVVGFYRKLMGTAALSIPMVDKTIVEKGPLLQAHHQAGLCAPVSILEVKQAVFFIWISVKPRGLMGSLLTFTKVHGTSLVVVLLQPFRTSSPTVRCQLSHELVKGYNRKHNTPRCMIKNDLQKAYDSIEWPFVKYLLLFLGFPGKFIDWIMECLSSVSYMFNVNGEVTKPLRAKKGLRKGDPISPYLFVICTEYLNRCLSLLKDNALFQYHPRCKKLNITHVCFADDLLLFSKGDVKSVRERYKAFQLFSGPSGLKANGVTANLDKSSIYFGGVCPEMQNHILEEFQFLRGDFPFKYLGVPLSTKKLSILQFQPLILKVLHRINSWTAKLLSYAGRLQLIKDVLLNIQSYWSQVFLIPIKVLHIIQSACCCYLWSGSADVTKRALVAWDKICLPKVVGGLNITDLVDWNKIDTPKQASWMVKKIVGASRYLNTVNLSVFYLAHFSTRKTYNLLRGSFEDCDTLCCLCKQEQEDIDHLFFLCSWSTALWSRVLHWIGCDKQAGSWTSEIDFVSAHVAGNVAKHQIYRMALFTSVYFVWRERNQR